MQAYFDWLNSLLNKNKSEFAQWKELDWLNPYNTYIVQNQRDLYLEQIDENILFKETKPYYNKISKGCSICGSGTWSCLFITGKCNANCFYCPTPQKHDDIPGTQGFNFDSSEKFADYINHFSFKGVSFSGGEPLLYFERTLEYLKMVRKKCSPDVYIWMYTNGILADTEKMKKLADAGLDEIRFDIGATGYSLEKIKTAQGIIQNITIEIPAVPEEKDNIIKLLPEMIKAGVTNLNLHQLRLTQHNAKYIEKRNYTIINAERPIILESELAALEILNSAMKQNLDIGINYCSFFFKNRFQKAGFRKQMLQAIAPANIEITENGYIRELTKNSICYKTIRVNNERPLLGEYEEIVKEDRLYFVRTEILLNEQNVSEVLISEIQNLLAHEPENIPTDPLLFKIWQLEYIEKGLREY